MAKLLRRAALPVSIACATLLAACGSTPPYPTSRSTSRAVPHLAPASSLAPTAGSAPSGPAAHLLAQQLHFRWRAGYTPPAWLPSTINATASAPGGGAAACGVDAGGQYTAVVVYDARSPSALITIQVHHYAGPRTYSNSSAGSTAVDVEVSPPESSFTGLSGFDASAASVTVNSDAVSGAVSSPLASDGSTVGMLAGSWRCA